MNINPSEVVDDNNNNHHHHRGYHQAVCRCKYNQRAYDYLLVKAIQLKQNDFNINIKLGLMKAAKSVLKYPLPILSEEEALLLNGVGKTIAKEIMKALSFGSCPTVAMKVDGGDDGNITRTMSCDVSNRSCDDNQHSCIKDVTEVEDYHLSRRQQQHDVSMPLSVVPTTHSSTTHTSISHASTVEDSLNRNSSTSQLSMNNSTRKYIPEFGKVPWTILIALYRLGGNANKAQIEMEVFELNRTHDFIHADSYRDTKYPSLSILKKKGLIEEVLPTGHLWLTETGTGTAIELHAIFLRRRTPIVSTTTTTTTTAAAAAVPPLPSSNKVYDDHHEDPRSSSSSINYDVIIGEKDHDDVVYNRNRIYARSNSISYNSSNGYHRGNNDDEDRYANRDHPTAIAAWSDVGKGVPQSYLSVTIRRPTCEVVDLCSPPMVSNTYVNTDNVTEDQQYQYRSQSLAYNKHSLDPSHSPHTPLPVRPCRITTPSFVSIPLIAIEGDHRHDGGVMDDHRCDGGAMDDRHDGHYGGDAGSYDGGAMDDEAMICYPPVLDDVRCTVESYQTRLMRSCCSDDAPRTVTAVREHSIAAGIDPTSRLIDYRARMDVMKEERNIGGVVDLTLDDSSADEAHVDDYDDGDDDMMELHIGRDQSSSRNLCSIDSNAAIVVSSPSPTSTATTTTTTTAVRSLFSHIISARPLHEEYVHTTTHTNCIDIDIDIINPHDDDRGMCNDKDAITDDRGNVPVVTTGCHTSGSLFSMLASKHKQFLEARAGQAAIPPSLSSSVASSSVVSASSVVGMERSMTSAAASTDKEEVQKENVHSNIVGVLNSSKARKRSTATTTTAAVTARNNKSHKEAQAVAAAAAAVDRTIIMNGSSAIVSNATAVAAGTTYIEGDQQTRSGEGPVGRSYYQQKQLLPLSSLHACDWEVVLLIDKRERSNALIQGKMVANGVPSELCNLAVGDFLWVVRPALVSSHNSNSNRRDPTTTTTSTTTTTIVSPTTVDSCVDMVVPITCGQDGYEEEISMSSAPNQSNHNHNSNHTNNNNNNDINGKNNNNSYGLNNSHSYFVLDCVAERKTIADLASSISDGRYIEQKSRLKACNLRSTVYIIEGEHIIVPTQQRAITAASIKTAIVSINVDNDMNVLRTRGIDHTITCLLTMHRQVQRRFIKTLLLPSSCPRYQPFPQFQQMYMKQGASTNKQLFGFQLRQIHGCSTAVAMILMEIYGTTANFMHELHKMGPLRAEFTLTNLKRYGTCKKIGPILSKRICRVYLDKY